MVRRGGGFERGVQMMKESQSKECISVRWDVGLNKKRVAYFLFPKVHPNPNPNPNTNLKPEPEPEPGSGPERERELDF